MWGAWAAWTGECRSRFALGTGPAEVLAAVEEAVDRLEALPDGIRLRAVFDGAVGTRPGGRRCPAGRAGHRRPRRQRG